MAQKRTAVNFSLSAEEMERLDQLKIFNYTKNRSQLIANLINKEYMRRKAAAGDEDAVDSVCPHCGAGYSTPDLGISTSGSNPKGES